MSLGTTAVVNHIPAVFVYSFIQICRFCVSLITVVYLLLPRHLREQLPQPGK